MAFGWYQPETASSLNAKRETGGRTHMWKIHADQPRLRRAGREQTDEGMLPCL
jgi:hypothetical protein